ncbi:MAG: thioredoxin [bacterium]|nr:thioredoxin [bacterium]
MTTKTAAGDIAADAAAPAGGGLQARLQRALEKGSWLAFLLVFLGGVLASFTPCVYPMIPITISYIGGNSRGRPLKGFVLSLWYVLGIALVYSILGVAAAATGGAFGQATQTPVFAAIVAAIIGAMALSMAGLFDLQLPSSLTSRVGGGRTGFLGPLLMGAAMGLIAAPCVGPVLIVLLTWVATTGNLVLGFWLLFTFALGLGVLFVALGTFSGLLTALPGAGGWMQTVKHVFAVVLFALALWFLRLYVPVWLLAAVFGLALLLSVSAWGAWRALPEGAGARAGLNLGGLRFLWLLGATLAILGGLRGLAPGLLPAGGGAAVGETAAAGHDEPAWLHDDQAAFAAAREQGKPLMMDFWAAWCAACLELDERTYNQPAILALAGDFVAVKMDLTERSAANDALARRYGVVGMPTVLFFDPQGRELERFSGFMDARDLGVVLERVRREAARATASDHPSDRGGTMSQLIHVTDANFQQEVLDSALPVVVDFSATWCGPCKQLKPIVEELAAQYAGKVKIAHVDVDEARQAAMKYGVMSVPTVLYIKGGQVRDSQIGVIAKEKMAAKIDNLI